MNEAGSAHLQTYCSPLGVRVWNLDLEPVGERAVFWELPWCEQSCDLLRTPHMWRNAGECFVKLRSFLCGRNSRLLAWTYNVGHCHWRASRTEIIGSCERVVVRIQALRGW